MFIIYLISRVQHFLTLLIGDIMGGIQQSWKPRIIAMGINSYTYACWIVYQIITNAKHMDDCKDPAPIYYGTMVYFWVNLSWGICCVACASGIICGIGMSESFKAGRALAFKKLEGIEPPKEEKDVAAFQEWKSILQSANQDSRDGPIKKWFSLRNI